ncbi:MAG: hypothetical protein RL653_3551, partial [Pseudomonadota bacterium]
LYLLESGAVEVSQSGGESPVRLGAGEHVGEVALLRDVPRTATVRVVEPGRVWVLGRAPFLAALAGDLSWAARFEAHAASRLGEGSPW